LATKRFRPIREDDWPKQREARGNIEINLLEDMNSPPRIYAVRDQRKKLLLDLNPIFSSVDLGHVQSIEWPATDGQLTVGGLYLPPNYSKGVRYPVVIQTHGFAPYRFSLDGLNDWNSAFAARVLASKGMIVAQIGRFTNSELEHLYVATPEELPKEMSKLDGLINYLDQQGYIDENRVGIVGFSRTVLTVGYALTHSQHKFAAASLVDGIDGSLTQYRVFPAVDGDLLQVVGAPPWGSGLRAWLEKSPEFNLDRVETPVRVLALGRQSLLTMWDWYSGLEDIDKAVEMVCLPFGSHVVVKPWERLAAQEGLVDWMCFWLQGREDSSLSKASQYARWRIMKARRSSTNSP
jgi:hypothetical protein